ncbi:uncharacterized protein EV422DRAFT_567815 [Fimicolochytrium jonesii]|uniref:uncharacterized protein n=1 Tax=Fimicolochytrium jonesii TaxID=1396493 RepID=UPI0022FE410D|nr:uncharacterized protein EV422DRAFT_567815 [Fimicolochytrium jonesii]KAI8820386.1 hypothetical protein EV422DRAFT_567815 [Fimicolochytrium jonesii]
MAARRIYKVLLFMRRVEFTPYEGCFHMLLVYVTGLRRPIEDIFRVMEKLGRKGFGEPSLPTWVAIYYALWKDTRLGELDRLVLHMLETGVFAAHPETAAILFQYHKRRKDFKGALLLYETLLMHGHDELLSPSAYSQLLICASRARSADGAVRIFADMRRRGLTPDSRDFGSLLSSVRSDPENRRNCIKEQKRRGLKPTIATITILLQASLREAGRFDPLVYQVFNQTFYVRSLEVDLKPDVIFFSVVINYFVKHRLVVEARLVFEDMARHNVKPDAGIYGSLAQGYLAAGDTVAAEYILQLMTCNDLTPNRYLLTKVINGYLARNDFKSATQVVEQMRKVKWHGDAFVKDPYLLGAFLAAFARNGDPDSAVKAFYDLKDLGLQPDVAAYTQLIYLCRHDFALVRSLWEEMAQSGIDIDVRVCQSYLYAVAHANQPQAASSSSSATISSPVPPRMPANSAATHIQTLLDDIEAQNIKLDMPFLSQLIFTAAHLDDPTTSLHIAETLITRLRAAGYRFSTYAHNQMLNAALALRTVRTANDVAEVFDYCVALMREDAAMPNQHSYLIAVKACCARQLWTAAMAYYRQLVTNGLVSPPSVPSASSATDSVTHSSGATLSAFAPLMADCRKAVTPHVWQHHVALLQELRKTAAATGTANSEAERWADFELAIYDAVEDIASSDAPAVDVIPSPASMTPLSPSPARTPSISPSLPPRTTMQLGLTHPPPVANPYPSPPTAPDTISPASSPFTLDRQAELEERVPPSSSPSSSPAVLEVARRDEKVGEACTDAEGHVKQGGDVEAVRTGR